MSIRRLPKAKIAAASILLSIFTSFGPGHSFVFFDPEDSEMVGNPAQPLKKQRKVSIGLEYGDVSNREMVFSDGVLMKNMSGVSEFFLFTRPKERINDVKIKSNRFMVKGAVGIESWLDFFIKIGAADVTLEYKRTRPGFVGQTIEFIEFNGRSDVAFGAGVKGKIRPRPWPGWIIMGDAQVLKSKHDGNYTWTGVDFPDPDGFSLDSTSAAAETLEWQAAIYLAKVLGASTVYGGAKYSDLEIEVESHIESPLTEPPFVISRHEKYDADKNIGLFIGAEADIIPNRFNIGIELRYIDETASSFSLNWRF